MLAKKLLVANRGEIAIRIMRAAAELGIRSVAVFSEDDGNSLHTRRADEAIALKGVGAAAYLDLEQIIAVAKAAGCDAIHPGYGFLSENASFARRCNQESITFVGPRPETLELFGNKVRARELAERCGVPVLRGTAGPTTLETAKAFMASLEGGAVMIKAIAGGGGRGMRAVYRADEIEEAYRRCQSEALAAFGDDGVYLEQLVTRARHLEVQIVGDGSGEVSHLWERECSIQRRNQKIVEIAPSPTLDPAVRKRLIDGALSMAREVRYQSLGTFEFLLTAEVAKPSRRTISEADRDQLAVVEAKSHAQWEKLAFIEANPRLQVEHPVTEEVVFVNLVASQLKLATGASLRDVGLAQAEIPSPRGYAIELRINMESMNRDGTVKPSGGTLTAFEAPSGPGVRVDTFAYTGYTTNPRFDSLLAKLIAHSPSADFAEAVQRAYRALCELRIDGVATNVGFLQNLLQHPDFVANRIYTRFVEDHAAELSAPRDADHRRLFFESQPAHRLAGARIDSRDPLAVLDHGKSSADVTPRDGESAPAISSAPVSAITGPENTVAVLAPMQGTIVSIDMREGDSVARGRQLLVMEAMKMEHVIHAQTSGVVRLITVARGDTVFEGHALAFIEEREVESSADAQREEVDLDRVRPDLAEVHERHAIGLDAARPAAVARRRKTGQRTARENIEELCDPGTFVEYGPLVVAAQRRRRTMEDLIKNTPADGLITGLGTVNGDLFGAKQARCVIVAYDYTVLAGTQGHLNHRKKDRMFELARELRMPTGAVRRRRRRPARRHRRRHSALAPSTTFGS